MTSNPNSARDAILESAISQLRAFAELCAADPSDQKRAQVAFAICVDAKALRREELVARLDSERLARARAA